MLRVMDHQDADEAEWGGEIEKFYAGGSNGRRGLRGDWGLHHKEAEYGRAIYCDVTDSGPL